MNLPLYNQIYKKDVVSVRLDDGFVYNAEFIGYDVMEDTICIGPLTVDFKEIQGIIPVEEKGFLRLKTFLPKKHIKSITLVWQHPLNLESKNSTTDQSYQQEAQHNLQD